METNQRSRNMRTIYDPWKFANIANATKKNYQLLILGICDTRWTETGHAKLTVRKTIISSANKSQNTRHIKGEWVIMTPKAARLLLR